MDDALTRHFLGWQHPAIASAIRWCIEHHLNAQGELNLEHLVIVTPGRRASRLLLSDLVDHCQSRKVPLIPPKLLTPSGIARELLRFPFPQASEMSKKLAWVRALQATDIEDLKVIVPNPPESSRWDQWIALADWLDSTTSQLSDAGLRMNQICSHAELLLDETEQHRWECLGAIQDRYEQHLADFAVVDDHIESLKCIERADFQDHQGKHLILLGVPELGFIPRSCIECGQPKLTSLVFAPESLSERFDELGCIRTQGWLNQDLDIDESRIQFSAVPRSMCEDGLAQLALRSNPLDTSTCIIGLADEGLLGTIRRTAAIIGHDTGINIHDPAGTSVRNTTVGRLVELIHNFLSVQTYANLAELIRHPHFEQILTVRYTAQYPNSTPPHANWLRAIDELLQEHVLLNASQLPQGVRDSIESKVRFALRATLNILDHMTQLPISEPTLDEWSARLIRTLETVYESVELNDSSLEDRKIINQLEAIQSVHLDILSANALGQELPKLTASSALTIILARLGEIRLPDQPAANAIESVGWLELALDPSPIAVVLGMNDSAIPGSITHDPLLPGSLRAHLEMRSNSDRLARDAYLLTAINSSRDAVFMTSRMSASNEPTTPSRLLFQTKGQRLASRMRRFLENDADTSNQYQLSMIFQPGAADLSLQPLIISDDYTSPESMSVTEFDAYLRSPASWYLDRSLRLREVETNARELNAMQIGNLAHAVLDSFGKDETMRALVDPSKINAALQHLLNERFIHSYGSSHPGAVKVQFELLSYRLRLFAQHQATRAAQGWQIAHTEWTPPESSLILLRTQSAPMPLRGKIDRIDLHPDGKIAVIDYKTGRVTDPINAHFSGDKWIKLQLPLYRHLVEELIDGRDLELGYAGLPSSESEGVWKTAQWDPQQLNDTDQAAAQVVNEIRAFEPGDIVPEGVSPPNSGIAGFITGERFQTGGAEFHSNQENGQNGSEQ